MKLLTTLIVLCLASCKSQQEKPLNPLFYDGVPNIDYTAHLPPLGSWANPVHVEGAWRP